MSIIKYTPEDIGIRLNDKFTVKDFYLDHRLKYILLDDELVELIYKLSKKFRQRPYFAKVTALYRDEKTNLQCGGIKGSYHLRGMAADIGFLNASSLEVAQYAEKLAGDSLGIGIYSDFLEYIHLDTRTNKARWSDKLSSKNVPGFGGVPVVFRLGDFSPAIKLIQNELNFLQYGAGPITGYFDNNTRKALSSYQIANDLLPTGQFDYKVNVKMRLFEW